MNSNEIVMSFVVGLLSGVISSILVTIFYRSKDSERERQNYFLAFRQYIAQLSSINATDIDKVSDFFTTCELPIIYRWIRLKKDELILVDETQRIIVDYYDAVRKLHDKILHEDEYMEIELEPDNIIELTKKHALITCQRLKVAALGNKTLAKYINDRNI